ncbi:hypothetical protein [Streptomyces sp. AS02]|nr:hypothetical protein [Streptomyces sp. AS02]MCL8017907.1 hypothetical protein [Streptomyces sp. AS02]
MSDAAHQTSHDRAIDVVRGHTDHDGIAVQEALAALDAGSWLEVAPS